MSRTSWTREEYENEIKNLHEHISEIIDHYEKQIKKPNTKRYLYLQNKSNFECVKVALKQQQNKPIWIRATYIEGE